MKKKKLRHIIPQRAVRPPAKSRKGLSLFFILLVTFVCFFPSLQNQYTNWDDDVHFLNNALVLEVDTLHLKAIFTTTVLETYIPLTMLSFALEHQLFGFHPFVSHLINLLLHLAVVGLVFLTAFRLGLKMPGAGLAALLFAVHPMHVESVAWVVERKDVLYAFFYMLSVYFYLRYLDEAKKPFYGLSVFSGILSLLAKAMALSLPLILFLLDWFKRRERKRLAWLDKIPYVLYIIPITWITYSLHARLPGKNLGQALLIWVWSFVFYLRKFFLPIHLVPLYELPKPVTVANAEYALSVLCFAAVIVLLVRFRKNKWFLLATGYYFFSIFFLLRFDEQADVGVVADRFMYLPSLGFCLFLAKAAEDYFARIKSAVKKAIFRAVLTAVFVLLGVETFFQCRVWKNSEVLWTTVLRYYPRKTIAYNNRGQYYLNHAQDDKALADFQRAVELNPRNSEAYDNMGLINLRRGKVRAALEQYDKALAVKDDNEKAYNNRGVAYQESGKFDLALRDYTRAIELDPFYVEAYINRANLFCMRRRFEEAKRDYDQVLKLSPRNFYAFYGKGMIFYFNGGQYDKAIEQYNSALKANPRYERAYFYRSLAFKEKGNNRRALEDALKARALGFEDKGYIEQLQGHLPKQPVP